MMNITEIKPGYGLPPARITEIAKGYRHFADVIRRVGGERGYPTKLVETLAAKEIARAVELEEALK